MLANLFWLLQECHSARSLSLSISVFRFVFRGMLTKLSEPILDRFILCHAACSSGSTRLGSRSRSHFLHFSFVHIYARRVAGAHHIVPLAPHSHQRDKTELLQYYQKFGAVPCVGAPVTRLHITSERPGGTGEEVRQKNSSGSATKAIFH